MTDTATETVETRYGAVEIETVECASCEETVAREDAHPFRIGDGGDVREGHACPICADEGPASYPERVREWALPTDESGDFENGLTFHVAIAPLALLIETLEGFRSDSDQFAQGYATAVVTLLGWALLLGGLAYAAGWSL